MADTPDPTNAVGVRFHPIITVDVNKDTSRVLRIGASFASSVDGEVWDYDRNTDQTPVDRDPRYVAAERVLDKVTVRLRHLLAVEAADLAAEYYDDQGGAVPVAG